MRIPGWTSDARRGGALRDIQARIALRCGRTEDRLNAKPTSALTPELIEGIREHKMEIIKIVREDGEMRLSDIVQSERQVFDLARELFGLGDGAHDGPPDAVGY